MRWSIVSKETLVIGIVLIGSFAVEHFLPFEPLPSLLLSVFLIVTGAIFVVNGAWQTIYRTTGINATAWLAAVFVAGGGIALAYLIGNPQPYYEGIIADRDHMTIFGWATTIYIGSTTGLAVFLGHLGRYRQIREVSAEPVDDVSEGTVAVEGRIVPAGQSHSGPVSGEETVWYRTATEKPTLFRAHREVDQEIDGNEFYVEDGSGRILVLPDRIDQHTAAEFATIHTNSDGVERHREWSYSPDDAVTVVGPATDVSRAKYPEPVVIGLDGPVIVANRRLDELHSWANRRAVLGGALALLFGVPSLLVMLLTA